MEGNTPFICFFSLICAYLALGIRGLIDLNYKINYCLAEPSPWRGRGTALAVDEVSCLQQVPY